MVINNVSQVVNDPSREQRIAMFRALNLIWPDCSPSTVALLSRVERS
jgi:hypothetical protein